MLFPAPESGGEPTDAALSELIDGMHEADFKRGGIGYLDLSAVSLFDGSTITINGGHQAVYRSLSR